MRAYWLGIALLVPGACLSPAAAQQVPRLDIEATCRAAPRPLKAMWGSAAASHRETCAAEAQIGGSPSYVDMLTCMEMAQGTAPTKARRSRH